VRIEAEAVRVAKGQSTPTAKKKRCKKGKKLRHGKCVNKGKKKHSRKGN
jgi:hypothetical protein